MAVVIGRRFKIIYIPTLLISLWLLYIVSRNSYQIRNTLSYATRPIWDSDDGPTNIIAHYYADGMEYNDHTCQLHGWSKRANGGEIKVYDAVLMSSELDLLEIRLNELDSVVDRFFIIESNATFTGLPKETFFANNRHRFEKFNKKIAYRFLPGYELQPGEVAWDVELRTRNAMTMFLKGHILELPTSTHALAIMSDLDEIPSSQSIRLLKECDFGTSIHLQLRNYIYSFEWFLGLQSWRASVHLWNKHTTYRHSKMTEVVLADAGWHCSYCFRYIPEYIIKMQGFSHHDRIGGDMSLLDPERIQNTICKGKDIFGMLPEAYRYADLLTQMNLEPQTTAVGLPRFLLESAERFKFLLPGGCKRENPDDPTNPTLRISDGDPVLVDDMER